MTHRPRFADLARLAYHSSSGRCRLPLRNDTHHVLYMGSHTCNTPCGLNIYGRRAMKTSLQCIKINELMG